MSKGSAAILDEYRDRYPGDGYDWRFRSGRMAEEMEALRKVAFEVEGLGTEQQRKDALFSNVVLALTGSNESAD